MVHNVSRVFVDERHEEVHLSVHLYVHQVGPPDLVRTARLLPLPAVSLLPTAPRGHQPLLPQNPVHRRRAQTRHILVDHPPRQLPMTHLRMRQGIVPHRPLLPGQRLERLHHAHQLARLLPTPGFLPQPPVVAAAGHSQRLQGPGHRPTASGLRLFHFFVHPLLQFRGKLTVVL